MFSYVPINPENLSKESVDREILRASIAAELDAVSLYEQYAETTENSDLKKVLSDIAKEEKTHVGEFSEMLLRLDKEQKEEIESGRKEVEDLTGRERGKSE